MAPLLIALAYGEERSALAFVITIFIVLIPGILINRGFESKFEEGKLKLRYSYFIVAFSWIIASLIGALPYVISGAIPSYVDAFFETCSGFTTTGSTILAEVESLPKSILFWRSLTQWLGGMGIVVLFVAFLPNVGVKAQNIAGAETPGPTISKLSSRFSETARLLYFAYFILTGSLFILLMLGGMSAFDAICHAMTALATGGFSTRNAGISYFNSNYIVWVLTLFMFLAGTNFNLFFYIVQKKPGKMFSDEEFRLYAASTFTAITFLTITLMTQGGYDDLFRAVTDASFQAITVMTTTGYATADFALWPSFAQMILIVLMLTGGSSSSTAGGIKEIRILIFFRMAKNEVKKLLHSNIIYNVKYNGKKMMSDTQTNIMTFITTYIFTLLVATFLVCITGDGNLVSNFTAALTCISNVGPGLDVVGPMCNFGFYSDFSKLVLSLVMVAGRLELSTFLIIFTKYFWRPSSI